MAGAEPALMGRCGEERGEVAPVVVAEPAGRENEKVGNGVERTM